MAHKIGRRSFLAAGVAAAGAAAVGSGGLELPAWASVANSTNGPGRNGVSTARPKRGGSLVFGIDSEEQGFSPVLDEWDENGYQYGKTVFDPLIAVTADGQPVPYLAQSVESVTDDFTSWVITMRPGITFHDGTPCDAVALHKNMEAAAASIVTKEVFSQFIKSATVLSSHKLRVDLTQSLVTLPYYLASQIGYVAAPSMLATTTKGNMNPVGTGPFVKTSWVPNTHFTAVRNPHYWRKGFPYLTKITYKPIIDATSRAQALELGTVDIINTPTATTIKQYRGNKKWSYVDTTGKTVGEPTVSCIQLNCGAEPFTDHNARLAMAKAYTQADIVKKFALGIAQVVTSPFVKGTPFYKKTTYPGYDPAGAKAAVKAYESAKGKPLAFTLTYIPDPTVQKVASYLQQRYQEAGMQVTLFVAAQNTLLDRAVAGAYQAVTWRQFGGVTPDLNYVFWSDTTVESSGISLNIARNKDPRIEAAMIQGRSAPSQAARNKAYQQVGEYLAQDLPYTWLGTSVWALIANPKVQNFCNPVAPNGAKMIGPTSNCWPTQIWID